MRRHVIILAWIHLIWNGLHIAGGVLALLALIGVGAFATIAGALPALAVLGGIGIFAFTVVCIVALPGFLVGLGLLNYAPWARVGGIILGVLSLLYFPMGTIIGIYGLWVLTNSETERLFTRY